MQIVRKDNGAVTFKELVEGDVFLYDNFPYMKMRKIISEVLDFNAVSLGSGLPEFLEDTEMVVPRSQSYIVIQ